MAKQTTDELAAAQIKALVGVPGALRIITNEFTDENKKNPVDPRSEPKEGVDLKRISSFVVHDVTRIEGPDANGLMFGYSDEGDFTMGEPAALLARLTEAGREAA